MISSNPKNIPTTRNRGAIEEIFIKATRIQSLPMGIVYFMSEELQDYGSGEDGMSKLTRWAVGVAKDTLRTGMDVVPPL
jgi:nucleolar MIF4G domain-containing protein 1